MDGIERLDFEPRCEARGDGDADHAAVFYLRCRNPQCRETHLLCDRALADARAHSISPRSGRRATRCCNKEVEPMPLEEIYEIGALDQMKPPRH
jgi:hypothetical protein